MALLLLLVVVVLLLCYFVSLRCSRYVQLGNKLPGPGFALPFIGHMLITPTNGVESLKKRVDMIKEYGDVCRFWIGRELLVIISDPEDSELILSSNVHIDKSRHYNFFHPWLGTGLLTSKGEKWRCHRKALTPAFHFKILEQFVDVFNAHGQILIEKLRSEVDGPAFDVYPYISRCALDIICGIDTLIPSMETIVDMETAMGTKVNAQVNSTSDYVQSVKNICKAIYSRMNKPWLYPESIFQLTQYGRDMEKALHILHSFTNMVVREKRQYIQRQIVDGTTKSARSKDNCDNDVGEKKRIAFLELLLEMTMCSDGASLTDKEIREEVDTFMFEGHDTTTSAICFVIQMLGKHQDIQTTTLLQNLQRKAVDEQNSIFGQGDRLPNYQDLQQMKYLEQVIKETLRLYPSVPIISRHLTEDVNLKSGHILPAGSIVAVSVFFQHRNAKYFPDPLVFNPDNFLFENAQGRHPYAYVPFSAGPRNCIGQKFAMLEMKSTLSKILRHYHILYPGVEMEVIPDPQLILRSYNGYHIKLQHCKPVEPLALFTKSVH